MAITIKFVGSFRGLAGKSKISMELDDDTTLREATRRITEKLPKLEQVLADSKPNMLVLVNGKEISVLKGLDTLLGNGDEVIFIPVLHGG